MSDINDGGPAFPLPFISYDCGDGFTEYTTAADIDHGGMSLRDYFAGQAMITMINKLGHPETAAERAYAHADAMLKAREAK
jgi:hypothetical protein